MITDELVLIGELKEGDRFKYYGGVNIWIVKRNLPGSNDVWAVMESNDEVGAYTNKKCKVQKHIN